MDAPLVKLLQVKNEQILSTIEGLPTKHKRKMFALLRQHYPFEDFNYLYSNFGVTLGEFCVAHVIHNDQKRKSRQTKQTPDS
uniref:Uncharacterized protein n=1 Tax=viral metagenome TaxID=1070528 RepID=A0A6C0BQA0_9ZZZZ